MNGSELFKLEQKDQHYLPPNLTVLGIGFKRCSDLTLLVE